MSNEDDFIKAQAAVKQLATPPDNDTLLELYALYKQATAGDAAGPRPGMMDPVGRAKFDAWSGKQGLAQAEARRAYVALVEQLGA